MMHHDPQWQERVKDKIATAGEAIRRIQRGRRILIGSGAAEPNCLVEALVTHGDHLQDNEIVHLLTLGEAPYVEPGWERRFRHTAFFIGENVRAAVADGRADFMPVFLSEIPTLIRTRRVRIDVALVMVSPPDRHGYVSLGVGVDIIRSAIEAADLVLAEVNPQMPRTHGDSFLHVSRLHAMVPVDYPLPERILEPPDEVSRRIGRHVASVIPDGATLQMGIGTIPNAVLDALGDRNDLGVHTEMFSDGVMALAEKGVINGRAKTLLPGKIVTSFVMGSRAVYEWVHENPVVEMRPSNFTNDPFTIARNDRMCAINSALAVDLTGQVAADTLMGRFFSGIGGQVDFIRGSARSLGGKPIIALPSTAKNGTVSRIQPAFEEGAGIVTSRGDVHVVATEWGVVDLWGRSIRRRAEALIEIAHPDFRTDLTNAAKKRRYVFPDQIVPRAVYPWEEASTEALEDGRKVVVRALRMSDQEPLTEIFYRASDETTFKRFMAHECATTHEEMRHLVDLDYERNMALVASAVGDAGDDIVAMARYDVEPATRLADIVFVVREEWTRTGVGRILMHRMLEIARERGLTGVRARIPAGHKAMLALLQSSGLQLVSSTKEGIQDVVGTFHDVIRASVLPPPLSNVRVERRSSPPEPDLARSPGPKGR